MIINYPTGLYSSVLPSEPQDSQNVTYLISMTAPPRTSLLFPKIPAGVAIRKRSLRQYDTNERRQAVGDLVYTVSNAPRQLPGNNARQYEIGEILEFDYSEYKKVNPMLVSDKTDIQHNLNTFDYGELGLTEADVALIDEESLKVFEILADRLNELRVLRSNEEVAINTNQKIVNEAQRNIDALHVMVQDSSSTEADVLDLIDKLTVRKVEAETQLQTAISNANTYAEEANTQLAKLRMVATVLK